MLTIDTGSSPVWFMISILKSLGKYRDPLCREHITWLENTKFQKTREPFTPGVLPSYLLLPQSTIIMFIIVTLVNARHIPIYVFVEMH